MEMCRACLSTEKDFIKMDSTFLNNYNLLTNLKLELSDENPLYTCKECFDAVIFCAEFREKCLASDLTLMTMSDSKLKNENDNNLQVKEEIILEYSTDVEETYDEPFFDYDLELKNEENSSNKTSKQIKKKQKNNPKVKKRSAKPIIKLEDDATLLACEKPSKRTTKQLRSKQSNDPEKRNTLHGVNDHDPLLNCGICSKSFTSPENLDKHLDHHKCLTSCGLCTEHFIDFTHLLSHRIVHLPYEQKRCHICFKRYVRAEYLEFHYMKKHNLRGENGQLICKQCLVPYANPRKLHSHNWAVHSDIKFVCDDCGKGFRIKTALKSHLRKHNNNKNYKCNLCDFSCKIPTGLKMHQLRRHTEGRVICKTCDKVCSSQEIMDKHKCKAPLIIVCPICGICFKKSSFRKRHMLTHTDEVQYKCDRCPAKYRSKSSFKAHVDKHDGIRSFNCEYCPMNFTFQSALIKHRRIHTGEKPYVCKICSKAFTGNYNLKVHMKVHGINLFVKKEAKEALVFNNFD